VKNLTPWNPFKKTYQENPHAILKQLREHDPVHRGVMGAWIINRYDDVKQALSDPNFQTLDVPQLFLDKEKAFKSGEQDFSGVYQGIYRWILFKNPPVHTDLRRMIYPIWAKLKVEERVIEVVKSVVQSLRDKNEIDFIKEVAELIPLKVVCSIIGIDMQDSNQMRQWSYTQSKMLDPFTHLNDLLKAKESTEALNVFFGDLVVEKEKTAGTEDNFLSALLAANNGRFERQEIVSILQQLFFAGVETTIVGFGLIADCLVRHPRQWAALPLDEDAIQRAVNELLRYNPPLRYTIREVQETVELGNKTIRPGERIYVSMIGANRDPEIFADPDQLDLEREDNPHLAFGFANHYCMGAKLAKMELQYLIRYLKEASLFFAPAGEVVYDRTSVLFQPISKLPLRVISQQP
jgi:cytochrome P450